MKDKTNERTKKGIYSVNKTIFSFLFFTLIFVFIASHDLYIRASHINSPQIRTILVAILAPIDSFTSRIGISHVFTNSRQRLLELAKLDKELDWENYYYKEDDATIAQKIRERDDIQPLSKIKNKEPEKPHTKPDDPSLAKENEDEKQQLEEVDESYNEQNVGDDKKEESYLDDRDDFYLEEPILQSSPYIYDENNPFHLLMVGDSQMYSVANGLKKLTAGQEAIEITDISIHSSGFIRGDYYNWEKKLENIFKEKPDYYHAVVILLGMNDYQDIFESNKVLVRESKEWEAKYRDKIVRVINLLLLNTKKVYWLGMPVVRRASYNDDLRYIDSVQERVAGEYNHIGLKRISLAKIAPGEGVPYTESIQKEDGKIIRIMKADGVHYTLAGGQYVMENFLQDLYTSWYIKPPEK